MIKILLVDDSEFDREKMMRSLKSSKNQKYEFQFLDSGSEFENEALKWKPDLIILDLHLPEFGGLDILRMLNEKWGKIPYPIVIATGNGNESLAVEAMKLGALDYVVKESLNPLVLETVVKRALEKSLLHQQIVEQNELIRTSQKRLTLALESANMGSWEWDTRTDLIHWDSQTAAIMGIEKTSTPKTLAEFSAKVNPEFVKEFFKKANSIESYKEYHYVFSVTHSDQSVHWVKNYGKADDSLLENGIPVRFTGTCLDVTDQHLYKELQAGYLSLSRTDVLSLNLEKDLRERFVSTLSHDLRNPLAAAIMGTEILLRTEDAKAMTKSLNRILMNLNRVDHMIEDLLDANRLGAGQSLPLILASCDLTEVIEDCLHGLRLDHGDRFEFNTHTPVIGMWDKLSIQRVFENLLTNAVKYGTPETIITIKFLLGPTSVETSIHNHGPGLSKIEQENIFKPFHRTSSADNSNVRGWGLGLTIVQGITQAHGGEVRLESDVDQGVTFYVKIPR